MSCGASKPSDFDEHIKALEYYDNIPATIGPVESRLRAEMENILGADWCQRWSEGVPDYLEVPGQTNIMEILRLWTYAKSLDLRHLGEVPLQPAWTGRALVSRRECVQAGREEAPAAPRQKPVRREDSCHSKGIARHAFRSAEKAAQPKLIKCQS